MAAVGGTRNVIGNRMATPLTEPSPGIAPTSNPTVQPMIIIVKFSGCIASSKPAPNSERTLSMPSSHPAAAVATGFYVWKNTAQPNKQSQ